MGKTGVLHTNCMVLVHLMRRRIPGEARRMSPQQECLVGLKVFAEGGWGVSYM